MSMYSKLYASFLFLFILASFSTVRPTASVDQNSDKVSVALYYETMSPKCNTFIVHHLKNLINDDEMMEIVEFRLVPFGNANISNNIITCENGFLECLVNRMEACAIAAVPSVKEHFAIIHCIADYVEKGYIYTGDLTKCFENVSDLHYNIMKCYLGEQGRKLELKYAEETEFLKPPQQDLPWLTINGLPLTEELERFIPCICIAYTGTKRPEPCTLAYPQNDGCHTGRIDVKFTDKTKYPKPTSTSIKQGFT